MKKVIAYKGTVKGLRENLERLRDKDRKELTSRLLIAEAVMTEDSSEKYNSERRADLFKNSAKMDDAILKKNQFYYEKEWIQ